MSSIITCDHTMNAFSGRFTRSSTSGSSKLRDLFLAESGMPAVSAQSTVQAMFIGTA